jgi:hypothetical protein
MKIFKIDGGRTTFWQYDQGQRLIVSDEVCTEAHFSNKTEDVSPAYEVYEENGLRYVNVPDELLQTANPLTVFAYVKNEGKAQTEHSETFSVYSRPKPADYVIVNYPDGDEVSY